jgi:hypothetical protein
MIEFLFWVLLLPITIGVISLYFIVYQFVVNRIEMGAKKIGVGFERLKK